MYLENVTFVFVRGYKKISVALYPGKELVRIELFFFVFTCMCVLCATEVVPTLGDSE